MHGGDRRRWTLQLRSKERRRGERLRHSPVVLRFSAVERHDVQPMENRTTYAQYTETAAANQLIIVQHPSATDIRWSTLSITTKRKHMHVTYLVL